MQKCTSNDTDSSKCQRSMDNNITELLGCNTFLEEYNECQKLVNKFHHFYTYGNFQNIDCNYWKNYYNDCVMWITTGDTDAKNRLLQRKEIAQKNLSKNKTDTWNYRCSPPEMWSFPGKLRYDTSNHNDNKI